MKECVHALTFLARAIVFVSAQTGSASVPVRTVVLRRHRNDSVIELVQMFLICFRANTLAQNVMICDFPCFNDFSST